MPWKRAGHLCFLISVHCGTQHFPVSGTPSCWDSPSSDCDWAQAMPALPWCSWSFQVPRLERALSFPSTAKKRQGWEEWVNSFLALKGQFVWWLRQESDKKNLLFSSKSGLDIDPQHRLTTQSPNIGRHEGEGSKDSQEGPPSQKWGGQGRGVPRFSHVMLATHCFSLSCVFMREVFAKLKLPETRATFQAAR